MLEVMFPYKLGMTMTSNCWGFETSCIELKCGGLDWCGVWVPLTHVLSTIMLSKAIPELLYSSATALHVFKKRPSPSFMMLALWTQVTFYQAQRNNR